MAILVQVYIIKPIINKINPEYRSTRETTPQGKLGIGDSNIETSLCAQIITIVIVTVIKYEIIFVIVIK